MEKVIIARVAGGWRHRTGDGPVSEECWPTPSGALRDAGGDRLESVEIVYPDKDGRDTLPEDERPEPDAGEVEIVDEGSGV
jgi:hypothetical protein